MATAHPVSPTPRSLAVVRTAVAAAVLITVVHYLDNVVRYENYVGDDPGFLADILSRPVIAVFGVVYIAVIVWSARQFAAGRRERAALGFAFGASSGLASALHFVDVSVSDLDAFQIVGIVVDQLQGWALLTIAVWLAVRAPGPPGDAAELDLGLRAR